VWALGPDGPGEVVDWPPSAEALYGVPARAVLGRARPALLASAPTRGTWADVDAALRADGRWEGELLHTTPDGRPLLTATRLLRAPEPPPEADESAGPASPLVVEIARDVTAQRVAEEALRASQRRLSAVVDSALDAIVTADATGRVVLFNGAAERMFGLRAGHALGEPLDRFIPHDPAPEPNADDGYPRSVRARRADGSVFPAEATVSRVETPDGPLHTVIVRDVTGRVQAEAERERLIEALEGERAQLAEFALRAERARAEADAARREAEAASMAKTAFLATMSHELRTPLNAVLGYAELLDLGLAGPMGDGQRQYLGRIVASGRHLLDLITDVLDLSTIESGAMHVERQPRSAGDALRAAAALAQPAAAARGLAVVAPDAAAGEQGPSYLGDERRVQQILENLLANAVKFTDRGGQVRLTCAATRERPPGGSGAGRGAWVTLAVTDTGIGIPAEQHELVFARFHQVDRTAAGPYRRTQGGTGLGLALSRELARLMDGDLTVESAPGRGSTFTLWLPAAVPAVRAAESPWRRRHGAVGSLLADAAPAVVAAWAERLGSDALVPNARALGRAEVEDHMPSYVADLAQQFVIFDDPELGHDRVALVRDGAVVRQLLARQHGRQRARLGWSEAALAREYALLGEEIERALAVRLHDVPAGTVEDARALARAWLAAGARESAEALRAATGAPAPKEAPPGAPGPDAPARRAPPPEAPAARHPAGTHDRPAHRRGARAGDACAINARREAPVGVEPTHGDLQSGPAHDGVRAGAV
jgi:PAS domain S-box-containing protein